MANVMALDVRHQLLLQSIRRAAVLRGFLAHTLVFITVMIMFILAEDGAQLVPLATGWLIGLLLHGTTVVGLGQYIGQNWEERRLEAVMHGRGDETEQPIQGGKTV